MTIAAAAALADLDISSAQDAAGTRVKNSCFHILMQLQVSLA